MVFPLQYFDSDMLRSIAVNTLGYQEHLSYESNGQINR
jgi:hypothetical protein